MFSQEDINLHLRIKSHIDIEFLVVLVGTLGTTEVTPIDAVYSLSCSR